MNRCTNVLRVNSSEQVVRTGRLGYMSCWLLVFVFLFSAGCGRKQQAVDLYVDAVLLRQLDQNELAAEKLDSAIKADKRFSLAYSLLGEIYMDAENYEKSAAAYEKATQLNPWSFNDYFNLGRVYQLMNKTAKAVQAYVAACEVGPDQAQTDVYAKAHLYAARIFHELKDDNSALMYAERAERIDPNSSELQKLLGNIYSSQENYELATRAFNRSLELDTQDVEAMVGLAFTYLSAEQYQPAIEILTGVVQIQPSHTAYQHLGYCYLQIDDVDSAIESYNQALAIDDRDWEALNGLGIAYIFKSLGTGDDALNAKAKAVEQWRLSLEINPQQQWRPRLLKLIEEHSTQ
jgi:tetratricopeptide (TPR) repeat protein